MPAYRRSILLVLAANLLMLPSVPSQVHAAAPEVQPRFEVASIRVSNPTEKMSYTPSIDRFAATAITLRNLTYFAYKIKYGHDTGGPGWVDSERFDIDARVDPDFLKQMSQMSSTEKTATFQAMLRSLLEERFHLQVDRQEKILPAYLLRISKNGPKLRSSSASTQQGPTAATNEQSITVVPAGGMLRMIGRNVDMAALAANLSLQRGISFTVLDQTELTGRYDFDLEWNATDNDPQAEGSSIFTALQEQLGLRLESGKAAVMTLVIKKAEEPTPN